MRIARALVIVLLVSACSTHRTAAVRCDGPLVPINSGGSPAAAPVAQSNHTTQPEGDEPHGE
jgi:hypothetical protein